MPRTTEQNELIREATRTKLLKNAMQLYAEYGYAHTSIRKIAQKSDVSVGLLYHYFANKEALLFAVFENCMQIINEGFAGVQSMNDPLEKVSFLIRNIFSTLQADRFFWELFQSLRAQPTVLAVLGDQIRYQTKCLRDLFIALFIEADLENPEEEAYILYSMIEGTIQQYLLEPEHYPLENVVKRIVNQFAPPQS